ncbi:MAG: hypothetical protein QM784_07265 [Polyangiaceae bacterium]
MVWDKGGGHVGFGMELVVPPVFVPPVFVPPVLVVALDAVCPPLVMLVVPPVLVPVGFVPAEFVPVEFECEPPRVLSTEVLPPTLPAVPPLLPSGSEELEQPRTKEIALKLAMNER